MQKQESIKQKLLLSIQLGRALRLVWQSAPGWTIASLVLIVLQGGLSLYLMKLVVGGVTAGLAVPDRTEAFGQVLLSLSLAG